VLTSRVMEGEAELTREMGPGPEEAQGRQAGPGPEAMRAAMADYVAAVHTAYLDASADLTAGERGRLPLVAAGTFTVAAVGSQNLHIIGTCDQLPAPTGPGGFAPRQRSRSGVDPALLRSGDHSRVGPRR